MFPESFSYEERADLIRMEFDRRAPKIRLSIFAYLIEAGILESDLMSVEEFLELMTKVNEFITADVEDYAIRVAAHEPDETQAGPENNVPELFIVEGDDPYGRGGKGHM